MIPALLTLAALAALMLAVLPDHKTGRDGLYLVILWLSQAVNIASKCLFAMSEGYWSVRRRMRKSGLRFWVGTLRAYREAYDA